ncbi:MAG: TetR/AcrR family transcriptional regulator [Roseovarius sp.]
MTERPTKRLTRKDWLTAGRRLLATEGAEALKAEHMARYMKTTKGSFYWHFKDVPDFHARVLTQWEAETLTTVQHVLESEESASSRLRALAEAIAEPPGGEEARAAESAIRGWAASSALARDTVERVDQARLTGLRALLGAAGIANPEMARIIYAAGIGMERLGGPGNAGAMGSLVDLVLALR